MTHSNYAEKAHSPRALLWLTIGAIGVVFGDIGTSPLYALRESLAHISKDGLERSEVVGTVSLILWALIIVVTIKYIFFIMRADNKGEGGTLSLVALAQKGLGKSTPLVFSLGLLGAGLFFGDAFITPAISVLSAIEGLKIVQPHLEPYIIPLTIALIIILFSVQSRGTAKISSFFGPVTAVWFVVLAVNGVSHIADDLSIFASFNPINAGAFLIRHGLVGFTVMGSVFLAVTGAEAIYTDMGHFGKKPIRMGWLFVVFPSLALNYLGQGAFVLHNPQGVSDPFYLMTPEWALVPMILLATCATVIASQAVITGTYSLVQQAVQLGLLPRVDIRFTSETQAGQIYLPAMNTILMIGVVMLVLFFRNSSNLASAYGIAVSGTMIVTTTLALIVAVKVWKWPLWATALVACSFYFIDAAFFTSNLLKVADGGWVPLTIAAVVILVMSTWVKGSKIVADKTRGDTLPLSTLLNSLHSVTRVPGMAVFLTSDPDSAPHALLHNLKHNKVLHKQNVILTVRTLMQPRVEQSERTEIKQLSEDFWQVVLTYGYMETPNVPRALAHCRKMGVAFDIMSTSFFLGRRTFKMSPTPRMAAWRERLYFLLAKSATNATEFFSIPSGRVVELGAQILI